MSLGLMALVGCVSPEAHLELKAANDDLRRQLADLEGYQKQLEAENRRLSGEVERLGQNAADAEFVKGQREKLAQLIKEYEEGGAHAIPGLKVIQTSEGVAFQVQGEVLFASGQATLTKEGESLLRQLVPTLQAHGRDIRVDGHTDTDPIRFSKWGTNLRLSAERGMAVVEFLTKNGIDAKRLSVGAFGEHHPASVGDGAEAKRQNRRVEILMRN